MDSSQLSSQVSTQFGLPIDMSSKQGGLHAIANALNAGDVARAQIATVLLGVPDPPQLSKGAATRERMIKLIRDLQWSGMLKWDPDEHPRWPAGQSDGGQFRPVTDDTRSQPGATGGRNSDPSDRRSDGFWSSAASIAAAGAVEVAGNIAIGTEEIGTGGAATPAVPAEEAGLAALAGEAASGAAEAVAPSSRALGRALEAAGNIRKAGDAAHHIVAGAAPSATEARATLQGLGIGINDAANGVFLQNVEHASIHTAEYFAAVNRALAGATTKAEAERILQSIAEGLISGTFP